MRLTPFSPVHDLTIDAVMESHAKGFRLTFEVSGPGVSKLVLPDQNPQPSRRDELWKSTCFECFFGVGGSDRYYEFNGSPSGDWALYGFDSYRAGMKPHIPSVATAVPVMEKFEKRADGITCVWNIPSFTPEFLDRAGVTAVIESGEGVSYWAIRHAGRKPDFHLKDSFIHRFF
jgi:hypothetical protein